MSQEPEHPDNDSPQFEPSPSPDQPGSPPPAGAPGSPGAPQPSLGAQQSAPAKQSTVSIMSTVTMSVAVAGLIIGGIALYRVFSPPKPPGETSGPPPGDMVKSDDFKKLTDRVDKMSSDVDQNKKQISNRPDYGPQMKLLNDRLNELTQTVTQMPAQFDSINQKLGTVSKIEESNSSNRVDGIDKRVTEMNHAVDALRADVAAIQRSSNGSGGSGKIDDAKVDVLALEQAIDLFKSKKYGEARAAFVRLQTIFPNDARVWYYSALANGFSSGQWLGDTERMVNTGLEKEKAGQPESATIDAVFAGLTPETGKDWLASYRKRIGAR